MTAALDASTAAAAAEQEAGNEDAAELHADMASSLPQVRVPEFPRGNHGPADHPDAEAEHHAVREAGGSSTTSAPSPGHAHASATLGNDHETSGTIGSGSSASEHAGYGHDDEQEDGSTESRHHAEHGPEKLFGRLRLIGDEHTPDYARFNLADPLAGLYSERLRDNISRQAFRESDAETQDALIAQRAGVRYVEPGRTISPMMARLLARVASGDIYAPSAEAIATARAVVLRELVPDHGPAHTLTQLLTDGSDHHSAHGMTHRPGNAPAHESTGKPIHTLGNVSALPARSAQTQTSKGREREM